MTEHSQETKIAILEAKVDHMMGHVTELTKRVRAVEKVCAIVSAVGIAGGGIVGTTVLNPQKAEAHMGHSFPTGEWIEKIRDHESKKVRTPVEEMINNTLTEYEDGEDGSTEQEELLQLPSSVNRQSTGRRYDRCHHRSWIRFIQERTGKNCRSGHTREEN